MIRIPATCGRGQGWGQEGGLGKGREPERARAKVAGKGGRKGEGELRMKGKREGGMGGRGRIVGNDLKTMRRSREGGRVGGVGWVRHSKEDMDVTVNRGEKLGELQDKTEGCHLRRHAPGNLPDRIRLTHRRGARSHIAM